MPLEWQLTIEFSPQAICHFNKVELWKMSVFVEFSNIVESDFFGSFHRLFALKNMHFEWNECSALRAAHCCVPCTNHAQVPFMAFCVYGRSRWKRKWNCVALYVTPLFAPRAPQRCSTEFNFEWSVKGITEIDFIIRLFSEPGSYQISQATQLEGIKCKNSHLSDTYFIDRGKSERYTAVVSP